MRNKHLVSFYLFILRKTIFGKEVHAITEFGSEILPSGFSITISVEEPDGTMKECPIFSFLYCIIPIPPWTKFVLVPSTRHRLVISMHLDSLFCFFFCLLWSI